MKSINAGVPREQLPNNALEARVQLAMSRVMAPLDDSLSRSYLDSGRDIARCMGALAFNGDGPDQPFADEAVLHEAWGQGLYYEGMRQSAQYALES